MKTLAALFVVAALALSACDGGEVIPANDGMAGAAGSEAGGAAGAAGAGGVGVVYVPAPDCPALTSVAGTCEVSPGQPVLVDNGGYACYFCLTGIGPGTSSAADCALRDPSSNPRADFHGPGIICIGVSSCGLCHPPR